MDSEYSYCTVHVTCTYRVGRRTALPGRPVTCRPSRPAPPARLRFLLFSASLRSTCISTGHRGASELHLTEFPPFPQSLFLLDVNHHLVCFEPWKHKRSIVTCGGPIDASLSAVRWFWRPPPILLQIVKQQIKLGPSTRGTQICGEEEGSPARSFE